MTKLSGSQAIGAGFRVIRAQPLAPLAWGLVFVVLVLAVQLLGYLQAWPEIAAAIRAGAGAAPDIARVQAAMLPFQLLQFPLSILALTLIYAAIYRAVLQPRDRSFAYLRFGAQELWILVVLLAICVLFVLLMIGLALAVGITVFAARGGGQAPMNPLVGVLIGLAVLTGLLWLGARFSLALPMTFAERRFRLFESWALTRGHGWKIVGVMLALVLIVLLIEVAVAMVVIAVAFAVGAGHSAAMAHLADQPPATILGQIAPWLVVGALIYAALTGIIHTIVVAPFADIYRQLTAEPARPADFGGL